jgi:hypothetical protein
MQPNDPLIEHLDNEARLLAPTSPLHPLFDDVRYEWLRDFQVA